MVSHFFLRLLRLGLKTGACRLCPTASLQNRINRFPASVVELVDARISMPVPKGKDRRKRASRALEALDLVRYD